MNFEPSTTNKNGDASLVTIARSDHNNTLVCQVNQRPDSELAGLQQADEGCVFPVTGGRMRKSSIPNDSCYYYMATEVKSKAQAVLSSSLVTGSAVPATAAQKVSQCPLKKNQCHKTIKKLLTSQMMHTHTHITPYAHAHTHTCTCH